MPQTIIPSPLSLDSSLATNLFRRVYTWMAVALLITTVTAYNIAKTPTVVNYFIKQPFFILGAMVLMFILSIILTRYVKTMALLTTLSLFLLFSFLMGISLFSVFLLYPSYILIKAFGITALTFTSMSIWGIITKADLTGLGNFLIMLLFGFIISTVVNFFLASPTLDYLLSMIGILIFCGLTAVDTKKILLVGQEMAKEGSEEHLFKVSIMGAFILYLDFINLFLFIIRIMGRKK